MKKEFSTRVERNEYYRNLAIDYLKTKEDTPYYVVEYKSFDDSDMEFACYKQLTDEQCEEVKVAMGECERDEVDLWEYYDENGTPEYLENGNFEEVLPNMVLFENKHIAINVKLAVFGEHLENGSKVKDVKVVISEDDYMELLSWQMQNRYCGFNDLCRENPELFAVIDDRLRMNWADFDGVMPYFTPIYAADLVGIKDDVMNILGEYTMTRMIYSHVTEDIMEQTHLCLEERVLTFYYDAIQGKDFECRGVDNVDAIAVEKAFGVSTYKELKNCIKANYAGRDGVEKFQAFLDEKGIKYELKN